jgi:hypothetical protein
MCKSAFEGNILRLLRNEIQYELQRCPSTKVFLFKFRFYNLLVQKVNNSKKNVNGFCLVFFFMDKVLFGYERLDLIINIFDV